MNIILRSERVSDYAAIANINYDAFLAWHPDNNYVSEITMVDLLRHNSKFDSELSIVAELDGEVVGHGLFSPFKFIVMGEEQHGVVLGPIAVKPELQKLGIGRLIMEEGHKRAKEKGMSFSMLCGHPDYYPKFGYKGQTFALSGTKIELEAKDFDPAGFSERPVKSSDVDWIIKQWEEMHNKDELALFPGENISEWCNHGFACICTVISKDDKILGYVRYTKAGELNIKEFVARKEDFTEILAYLAFTSYGKAQGQISIAKSYDKVNKAIKDKAYLKLSDAWRTHPAFMIKPLSEEGAIIRYMESVEKGELKPGLIVFPVMFDVDDGRTE